MNHLITLFVSGFLLFGCGQSNDANKRAETLAQQNLEPVQAEVQDGKKRAYFASGCFWCVEAIFENIYGVEDVVSGYSGGTMDAPTYQNHGDHAEAIEVTYNPILVDFETLLTVYFESQNITQINGQGPDKGTSYRSIVFYQNTEEKKAIDDKITSYNIQLGGDKVAAQVLPFQHFYIAENYHQDFERLNPEHPYIKNISIPRKANFEERFPELLKENNK